VTRDRYALPLSLMLTLAPTKMLGTIIYVSLLVVNSMAVLSEDRFLARSELRSLFSTCRILTRYNRNQVGWASSQVPNGNAGFHQTYDPQTGYGVQQQGEISMKARLVDLISAVRTLMRSACHFLTISSSTLLTNIMHSPSNWV
jgi:hypothetical protein